MDDKKKSVIFLLALLGEGQKDIADKFGLSKSEVHAVIKEKSAEYHIDTNVKDLERYSAWWKNVMREEAEKLWGML